MARRRAAGLLLALTACFATATAAPTASNHTSLDLYDGAPEGCYYNFQHYGEGDRIMTNEPCLNCTCHNRMLMCYLKVCPFTKPIGQDCTIEKRADQCCPIVTCPDVPVDLLTSTTTSPAEYGPTGIGKLDKFGCSINGKYFPEGAKVPPSPNKPCEHCYCIRNMTTCVMQECTLHVDGCTPIYHKEVCCPVRYSCDHPEDEMPLLDDLSTTVRPTPGFLLTTTTVAPVTQMSQDCVYENQLFPDGALIKTEKACDHCYCMKGDIVCVVQECGTPMENEGKNCTALPPREGVCCPDTYICEGDEPVTIGAYDISTIAALEDITTLSPPRRTSSEGSGYRHDDESYTELPGLEPEIEGSGEEEYTKPIKDTLPETSTSGLTDEILAITEESHEYIPLTTSQPTGAPEITTAAFEKDEDKLVTNKDREEGVESQSTTPSKVDEYTIKDSDESITDVPQSHELGSGEPIENNLSTDDTVTPTAPVIKEHEVTTDINKQDLTTPAIPKQDDSSESISPVTNEPVEDEKTGMPEGEPEVTSDIDVKSTTIGDVPIDHDITISAAGVEITESPNVATESIDISKSTTQQTLITESDVIVTTKPAEPSVMSSVPSNEASESDEEPQAYVTSSSAPNLDDEFVTTEAQEQDVVTESSKVTEIADTKHSTTNTPMLEEIEKDTSEYSAVNENVPTQDDTSKILSTTASHIPIADDKSTAVTQEQSVFEDTTGKYDGFETTPTVPHKTPELSTETSVDENVEDKQPITPILQYPEEGVTVSDDKQTVIAEDQSNQDLSRTTTVSSLESDAGTTEPDKGLNTIPSGTLEDDISDSDDKHKTTIIDEKLTTESELDNRYGDDISSVTTVTSASPEYNVELSTESAFHKEDSLEHSTDRQESPELTTSKSDVVIDQTSPIIEDFAKTTETNIDLQQEIASTSLPLDINVEDTTAKDDDVTTGSQSNTSESAVTEKEFSSGQGTSTTVYNDNIPQTTEANQEDNEIFNEPRIPGEGDCLLNGITYTNESTVPSSNKCQSGCKCISSIIKCDPILCSLPPEMDNCETIYDSPDACCPTYVCDHKSETNPPESHSQMSGTESPVVSPITCHGDECVISGDQVHHDKPSNDCKSGVCPSQAGGLEIDSTLPNVVPEKPLPDQKQECIGDQCGPISCTAENGCQAAPCEGENCNIAPVTSSETQQCTDSGDCNIQNIPTKDCSSGNCVATDAQSDDTKPKETCTDKEGCQNIPVSDVSTSDQNISEQCSGSHCVPQTNIETSTAPILENTPEGALEKDSDKVTVGFTETFDKQETSTISSGHLDKSETTELPSSQGMLEEQPEVEPAKQFTTPSDLVTNAVSDTQNVDTAKPGIEEEYSTEEPDTTFDREETPVTPGAVTEERETPKPVSDEMSSEQPETNVTADEVQKPEEATKKPHELPTSTSVTDKEEIVTTSPEDITKPAEAPQQTDLIEPTILVTPELNEVASHSTQNAEESHTDTNERDSQEVSDSTIKSVEGSTEASQIFVTKPLEVTEPQEIINYDKTTETYQEENITEPPKSSVEVKPDSESHKESGTESTNIIETDDKIATTEYKETTTNLMEASSSTESSTLYEKAEDITSTPTLSEKESTTVKESDENVPSKESNEVKAPSEDSEQENLTEPSKHYVTVSLDVPQSTETIASTLDTSTKPPKDYDITIPEYSTEPSKTDVIATESPDKSTTLKISEEPPKSDDSTPQEIPVGGEREDTTSETLHEIATEPPQTVNTEPQDISVPSDSFPTIETKPATVAPDMLVTEPDQEVSSENAVQDITTSKIQEESATEPPRTYSTEQTEQQSTDDTYHEETTEKLQDSATEPSKPLQTEPLEESTSAEEYQKPTTSKLFDESSTVLPQTDITNIKESQAPESVTEPSKIETTPDQHIDVSTETSTQSIADTDNEIVTPKPTEENKQEQTLHPEITTSQNIAPESVETTTASAILLDGSRRTESEPLEPEKMTTKIPHAPDSDVSGVTENEQISTTSPEIIKDVESTIASEVDSKQPHEESSPGELESDKRPESDSHVTTLKPMIEEKDESQPESQETISSQPQPSDTVSEDDLRTTTSEKQDLTTSKPTESPKEPYDNENKTEHPIHYIPQEESTVSQESSTEKISTETIKAEDDLKTVSPSVVTVSVSEPITETTPISSDKPLEETPLEEPTKEVEDLADKTTSGYDTTKLYDEDIFTTAQPLMHETETTKLEDSKPDTAATETDKDHETSTESSKVEKDTKIPILISTTDTTEKTESVTSLEYDKSTEGETYSEVTSTVDHTTQKDHLQDENIIPKEPSEPEQQVPSTTISTIQLPSEGTTTVSIAPDTTITDTQTSVDIQNIPIETSPTSETPEAVSTLEPQVSEGDVAKPTEIQTDVTKSSESGVLETSSPSSSTEEAIEIEKQTTVFEEHGTVAPDNIITEAPESINNEQSLTTTLIPEQAFSSSTGSPLEGEQTVKEHDVITDEQTTETSRVTDSSNVSQPSEVDTEKQPETIQTVTPEQGVPIEDLTTIQPLKPDQAETTFEKSTQAPDLSAEGSTTTPTQDISQTTAFEHITTEQDQSVPVIISDGDKTTLAPKESDSVQTERVTQATEKPLHQSTPPEEEFLLATTKAPTTIKPEEEVPTSPAYIETTAKPTEKPVEAIITTAPEAPKPISTDVQPTDEIPGPDEDGSFPPSGPTSGYGSEPDYVEEDQTFGPGTCRYGGKVYVSAQQIPRDDPCDFCFCFRSDIICLQQSCPPPIHGCHEEPIQGFCCPRYECPVSMATTVNVTTTTTTTTTTLPPHFPTHSYKGSAQRRGCQIKGQTYKVGEVVRASSGPCLHCTCGGDGQMKCDPKVCTPEPMLRQMIAAAVSAKRRR